MNNLSALQQLPITIYLRNKIRQSLNPFLISSGGGKREKRTTTEKKLYLQERCSKTEFRLMFPKATITSPPDIDYDELPLSSKNSFLRTHKLATVRFHNVRDLDYLFSGEDSPEESWDVVFNGTAVGFICPTIEFRLILTEVHSHKTKLADDETGFDVIWKKTSSHTTVSISFYRGAATRWGEYCLDSKSHAEADWEEEVHYYQEHNEQLVKKRNHELIHKTVEE